MLSFLKKKRKIESFKALISIKNRNNKKKKTSIVIKKSRVVNSRLKEKSNLVV